MTSSSSAEPKAARVLLVEDEAAIRRATTAALEAMGHSVDSAAELDTAKTLLTEHAYDLALVDLNLRQSQGGFVLIRTIRARGLSVPIVVISSTRDHEDILAAFRLGAADFVQKPVRVSELAVVTRRILGGGAAEAAPADAAEAAPGGAAPDAPSSADPVGPASAGGDSGPVGATAEPGEEVEELGDSKTDEGAA